MKPFTKKEVEEILQDYVNRFVEPLRRELDARKRRQRRTKAIWQRENQGDTIADRPRGSRAPHR